MQTKSCKKKQVGCTSYVCFCPFLAFSKVFFSHLETETCNRTYVSALGAVRYLATTFGNIAESPLKGITFGNAESYIRTLHYPNWRVDLVDF